MNILKEKNWHRLFELGITLKGINGVLETVGGLTILLVSKNSIGRIILHFTRGELVEDPNDPLIHFLTNYMQHLSSNTKTFAAIYILTHGLLNLFLVTQLYRERLWAYLVTIGFMIIFMSYQLVRISHNHSLILTLITIWDVIFVSITWHEYKYRKSQISPSV